MIDIVIGILAVFFVLFVFVKQVLYYEKNHKDSNCSGLCMYCNKNCYKK